MTWTKYWNRKRQGCVFVSERVKAVEVPPYKARAWHYGEFSLSLSDNTLTSCLNSQLPPYSTACHCTFDSKYAARQTGWGITASFSAGMTHGLFLLARDDGRGAVDTAEDSLTHHCETTR